MKGPPSSDYRALLADAYLELRKLRSELDAVESAMAEPIAIVGMGCRFPGGANDSDSLWKLLRIGGDAITEIPPDRWDVEAFFDPRPDAPGKMYTRCGGFLNDIDEFDAHFFGISPREATSVDPQQRLILEVAWEALEDAGIPPDTLAGTDTGVFTGVFMGDYSRLDTYSGDYDAINAYNCVSNLRSMIAGRLSYFLDLHGPSIPVDTACSSSLLAVHMACQSLRQKETCLALAGGVNLILTPEPTIGACKLQALAPDGRCKTFSAAADGYVRGEGCGIVVLKRLSDALADRDAILAVVRGSAVNHDGRSNGLTAPNGAAQQAVIKKTLQHAGAALSDIDYIEAHGTGTLLGDTIEVQSLASVFSGLRPNGPLRIGSVKTNIGHLESAAGIASLIKVVTCLQQQAIPPTVHLKELNPKIDWDRISIKAAAELSDWPRGDRPRLAGISAFGMSGTNVHLIVEEPPVPSESQATAPIQNRSRSAHLLTMSAKDPDSLRALTSKYLDHLDRQPAISLADVCFSASTRRSHFEYRLAVTAGSLEEVRLRLTQFLAEGSAKGIVTGTAKNTAPPRIAFVFAEGLSGIANSGRDLYELEPVFEAAVTECDGLFRKHFDRPLITPSYSQNGRETWLISDPQLAGARLFALQSALVALWKSWGIEPDVVIGDGVGIVAAAHVAGVYSLADGLRLAASYTAVAPQTQAAPGRTVLTGGGLGLAPQSGARAQVASTIEFRPPAKQVISTAGGEVTRQISSAEYWSRPVGEPVLRTQAIEAAGITVDLFVEIGAGFAASSPDVLREAEPDSPSRWQTLKCGFDSAQLTSSLGVLYAMGTRINWNAVYSSHSVSRVKLPLYPFRRDRFWVERRQAPPKQMDKSEPAARTNGNRQSEFEAILPAKQPIDGQSPFVSNQRRPGEIWKNLYQVQWKEAPLKYRPQIDSSNTNRRWVILSDKGGVCDRLSAIIHPQFGQCLFATLPGESGTGSPNDAQTNSYLNKLDCFFPESTDNGSSNSYEIVYLRALDIPGSADCEDGPIQEIAPALDGLLRLIQSLARDHSNRSRRLWIVTRGAQKVTHNQSLVNAGQAAIWGLARVSALEHPELNSRLLDIDPDSSDIAGEVFSELTAVDTETQVAVRAGVRYAARLARLSSDNIDSTRQSPGPGISRHGSYLITGGLGDLGLRVASRLVAKGATHLVLTGRGAATGKGLSSIHRLEEAGVTLLIVNADVSDQEQVRYLFERIQAEAPPLRGVFHAAGVLDDGIIARQDWQRFKKVMLPKIAGTLNLHNHTSDTPLDFFVCFSSLASVFGSAGQANYAAANAFMDALIQKRRMEGLPGQSINWGPWAGVGMAARLHDHDLMRWESKGIGAMQVDAALDALDLIMKSGLTQVTVVPVNWQKFLSTSPEPGAFFGEMTGPNGQPVGSAYLQELLKHPKQDRRRALVQHIRPGVAEIIGSPSRQVDPTISFFDLGLDSLMAMELQHWLERDLGQSIALESILEHPTINRLTDYLLDQIG